MLSRVGAADGGRSGPAGIRHAEGVGQALAGVGHAHLPGGNKGPRDGAQGARVDDALCDGGRVGAGAGDDKVVEVQTELVHSKDKQGEKKERLSSYLPC